MKQLLTLILINLLFITGIALAETAVTSPPSDIGVSQFSFLDGLSNRLRNFFTNRDRSKKNSSRRKQKSFKQPSQSPMPNQRPGEHQQPAGPTFRQSTPAEQFTFIEKELFDAKARGVFLAPEHYQRVIKDLARLESLGYNFSELERLRQLALHLVPYLQDQVRRESITPIQSAPSFTPPSTTATPPQTPTIVHTPAVPPALTASPPAPTVPQTQPVTQVSRNQGQGCISNPNPVFTAEVTDFSLISQITPPGTIMKSGELKSHSYIWIKNNGRVPVYAPVDAELVAGVHLAHRDAIDYGLDFHVSCEVEFRLGHITEPIDRIRAAFSSTPKIGDSRADYITPIAFKAGDLIGYTTGTTAAHNWDFGVYNSSRPDPDAQAVNAQSWDAKANCPYDYFSSERRSFYRSLFSYEMAAGRVQVNYCD